MGGIKTKSTTTTTTLPSSIQELLPEALMEIITKVFATSMDALAWAQAQDSATLAALAGGALAAYIAVGMLTAQRVPRIDVSLTAEEKTGVPGKKWKPGKC